MRLSIITISALVCLAGCSVQAPTGGPAQGAVTIGFIVKQPEELWFQHEWQYAQQCADQYGFKLIKMGAPDGEKVLSAIDSLAANKAQGFVICTPDVRLGPAIMAKAKTYGMKVFSVDDQFVGADGQFMDVPYMGISASQIGRQVGESLYAEFKKRNWPVEETAACAITFDELNTVKERTDGTFAALTEAGFPAERIYRGAEKITDVPAAFDAANIVLTQHPEVKRWIVFSVNEEGVLGAIRAMEGRGFTSENVIAIGIGAGIGFMEFEKTQPTGYFATAVISPKRHGFGTTELLYKWIKDSVEPPKDTRTKATIATRENYKQVKQDLGIE
ncbi:MAG TPA: arabinose ABC transporter substrate-binding protein [Candidatus Hydrogenedentes bacterium]|nr:arabinose ABC transporter substrate-binding protein [Candidatus Hydrogenedentota bacterium]